MKLLLSTVLILALLCKPVLLDPKPAAIPNLDSPGGTSIFSKRAVASPGDAAPPSGSPAPNFVQDSAPTSGFFDPNAKAPAARPSAADRVSQLQQQAAASPNTMLQCSCQASTRPSPADVKAKAEAKLLDQLGGFCNRLVYVNGRPTYAPNTNQTVIPYIKPAGPALAKMGDSNSVLIGRSGPAVPLAAGTYKTGFQVAVGVPTPNAAAGAHYYAQVRFGTNPATPLGCPIQSLAVSFYHGPTLVGSQSFRLGSDTIGPWLPVTSKYTSAQLPQGKFPLSIQAAHSLATPKYCSDSLTFEVRRILVCDNTQTRFASSYDNFFN
ncbi:hypothetical protein RI367_002090 [Sorochytrium milnesiophthora]